MEMYDCHIALTMKIGSVSLLFCKHPVLFFKVIYAEFEVDYTNDVILILKSHQFEQIRYLQTSKCYIKNTYYYFY